jgi:UDP-3-O-[3-hydroxymyristoyl] glucosamine N-acyltransferase
MPTFTASELAQQLGGEVIGDASLALNGFAPAEGARAGHLTFAENEKYLSKAEQGGASAILVGDSVKSSSKTLIRVADPRIAFAKVLPLFFPEKQMPAGIHPTAVVAASAVVHPSVHVGPHCVVGERVQIGAGSVLLGGNHIGEDARLGEKVCLFPNVTVYHGCQLGNRVRVHSGTVIGADGFGYVFDQGQHRKVLQIGNVIIHDDVELGANVCVDRAALGSTVIGRGTKVDNLAQIAHNVVIGQGCLIVGQAGIGGSSTMGDFVVLAGQAGVIGHIHIGSRAIIAAKSGVMEDIPEGQKWAGTPAGPSLDVKRQWVAARRLREFLQRLVKIEKQVADLTRDSKG